MEIKCELCGNIFKQITASHLKREHQISIKEYLEKFPEAVIYRHREETKKLLSETHLGRISFRKGLTLEKEYGKERAEEIREKIKAKAIGRKPHLGISHSDKSKQKIRNSKLGRKNPKNALARKKYFLGHPEEAIKAGVKMRAGHTPETGKKISQKLKGRKNLKASITLKRRILNGEIKLSPFAGYSKYGFRKDLNHFVRSSWEANTCRILKFLGVEYKYETRECRLI